MSIRHERKLPSRGWRPYLARLPSPVDAAPVIVTGTALLDGASDQDILSEKIKFVVD
ncbi:hypothetical protein [Nannocystis sp. SCPEA4]|uniref:hypothetical protein n=1 Tax=Nannocystis sp. SCPEA4 TaxID=2996787 RepID=UPI00226E283D|nr:hypothetical protein [Nannocystis sp. SCPEA4]MCY1055945.1 hypothetical protein [Nannocystis sp. SCPEA4]